MPADTIDSIVSYIRENVAWDGDPSALTVTTALFDEGVLDSMAVVALITFLEEEYGVEIDEDEIILANFETIASISRLVNSKLAGTRSA